MTDEDPSATCRDPIVVIAGRECDVYFQNVYRAGSPGCALCAASDARGTFDEAGNEINPPGCETVAQPNCGCVPCNMRVDLTSNSQVEPGFDPPTFSARAYNTEPRVIMPGVTTPNRELVEFVEREGQPPWVTIDNDNLRDRGRWHAEFKINTAGQYQIELLQDGEVFGIFNMTVRPSEPEPEPEPIALPCPEDSRPRVCKIRDAEADDAAKCEGMSSPPKSRPKSTVNQLSLACCCRMGL